MSLQSRSWTLVLALELAPAALLNFAIAFAVATLVGQSSFSGLAAQAAVAAGVAAFLLAWVALRRAGAPERRFPVCAFQPLPIENAVEQRADEGELLLTDPLEPDGAAEELLLDDILEAIATDSRVVRLFEPSGVPSAGELQSRIDRHLRSGSPRMDPPDASEALHEALAALRQSLR